MNKKIISMTIALLVIASMALSACGGAKPTAPPTVAPATVAPATAAPATAVPPTAVPEPVTLKVLAQLGSG